MNIGISSTEEETTRSLDSTDQLETEETEGTEEIEDIEETEENEENEESEKTDVNEEAEETKESEVTEETEEIETAYSIEVDYDKFDTPINEMSVSSIMLIFTVLCIGLLVIGGWSLDE